MTYRYLSETEQHAAANTSEPPASSPQFPCLTCNCNVDTTPQVNRKKVTHTRASLATSSGCFNFVTILSAWLPAGGSKRRSTPDAAEDPTTRAAPVGDLAPDKEGSAPSTAADPTIAPSSDQASASVGGCFLRRFLVRRSKVRS